MGRKKKIQPFTEIEDFYIKGNFVVIGVVKIADSLGRSEAEVTARATELGVDLPKLKKEKGLAGTEVYSSATGKRVEGAASMTLARVMSDDEAQKLGAEGGKKFIEQKLKNAVAPVFPE